MLRRCLARRRRIRSHIRIPVTASNAGRIPPMKMMICHATGIPVPSWIRRIKRALDSGLGGDNFALASKSRTLTTSGAPLPFSVTVHSAALSVGQTIFVTLPDFSACAAAKA